MSIVYIIKSFDNDSLKLEQTLKSISENNYPNKSIGIVTDPKNIEFITDILNKNRSILDDIDIEEKDCPLVFNKFPFKIPTFCLGFGNGKIKQSDILNSIIKETKFADIYSVLNAGDIISNDHATEIKKVFEEAPTTIGLVYSDYFDNKQRIFQEPFIKEKIEFNYLEKTNYSFSKYVLKNIGLPDSTEENFKLKIASKYILVHIPYPLFLINYNE